MSVVLFGEEATDEPNPIHAYADDGTHSVILVVRDEDGDESAPMVRTLAVENTEPVAAFARGAGSIVVGEFVSFVDELIDPGPNGSVVRIAWDFGAGSYQVGGPSADAVYVHTYTAAGSCTVPLYVTDDSGGMSSVRQIVSVAQSDGPVGRGPVRWRQPESTGYWCGCVFRLFRLSDWRLCDRVVCWRALRHPGDTAWVGVR